MHKGITSFFATGWSRGVAHCVRQNDLKRHLDKGGSASSGLNCFYIRCSLLVGSTRFDILCSFLATSTRRPNPTLNNLSV